MKHRFLISLVIATVASGCTRNILASPEEDAARVADVRASFTPGDRGLFEIDFVVRSPFGLPATITGIQWEVWLRDRWFAAGTRRLSEPVPAGEAHRFKVELPVVFRREGPPSAEPASVEIGVRGRLLLGIAGDVQPLPFQHRQQITAAYLPRLEDDGSR
jgi:hypothetical protein